MAYSNGASSNQIQIGDKVLISSGFSSATFGTYVIDEVTSRYFEVSIALPEGIPLEVGITPGAAGLIFYSSAKIFLLIAAQDRCAVQINGSTAENILLEPEDEKNPEAPAVYVQQGTIYSLSIKNLGVESVDLLIASAE